MSIYQKIKTLDNKFSWSFFGFLIGILGFGYAIYVDQFKEQRPKLVYDLLSNTQVLSVKEDVNKLDIIYDGQNLKERKENLILLTVRIKNEGNLNIKEGDFYSQIPFGLKIAGGKIAENPQLIDASNKFLRENVSLAFDTLNTVTIGKVPIDMEQFFTIKILTICNQNISPSIIPIGKISGIMNEFEVRKSYLAEAKKETSFFERVTNGSIVIHVTRFFLYIIALILFAIFILVPLSEISSRIEERKRKEIIKKFRDKTKIELTDKIEIIFDIYKTRSASRITWLNKLLNDKEMLKQYLSYANRGNIEPFLIHRVEEFRQEYYDDLHVAHMRDNFSGARVISLLVEKKVITITEDDIEVDEQFKKELKEFNYFIDVQ